MSDSFRPLDTIDQLLAAAHREGLDLSRDGASLDTMGLDFVVVHARDASGTPWIVRSPRRASVVESSRHEARVLACVAPALQRVGIAVPSWRVHAGDVIAYPRIADQPAITLDDGVPHWHIIDPAALSEVFIGAVARALTALDGIEPEPVLRVTSIAEERAALATTLDTVRAALEPPEPVWARWQRWLNSDATWPTHVALSHGDLHPGHMLLDASGRLTGILDWTEARVSDPAIDLAMFHMCFGRPALDALATQLAAHGFRTWPAMVEHAIERSAFFPALGAEWAIRNGNEVVLADARARVAALATP
jgi:aminoglycoside phosphotransferase (APT) family kinase protein